jgi:putative acetyltransferase
MDRRRSFEIIRPAMAHELQVLRDVHIQAFGGREEEAKLVELLHRGGKAKPSLVAVAGGKVVASAVFSPVVVEKAPPDIKAGGLGPVAVFPEFQRRGIGSRLIEAGLEACREEQYDAIVVLGGPRFYGRFGFLPAMDFGISNEYVEDEHFMIRELREGVLSRLKGMVRYASEFREAGC